jgi:hypothetical protein
MSNFASANINAKVGKLQPQRASRHLSFLSEARTVSTWKLSNSGGCSDSSHSYYLVWSLANHSNKRKGLYVFATRCLHVGFRMDSTMVQ